MHDYSAFTLLRRGLTGHRGWRPAWRKARPKPAYDAVIVGGGGHGLATAYYLARRHGMRRIAVLEKGWLGGGNTRRNTTDVRSNDFPKASRSTISRCGSTRACRGATRAAPRCRP
jgi:sarcosine oxidase subunit beta